jgi:hypothetical protein
MSRAANADIVIGAIPMPAETRDTARLRCVSNQPVTQAIMGAKMAAVAPPTTKPKINVSDGELASQASRRIVDALGSRQPIRQQRLPQTSQAISHNAIEPRNHSLRALANRRPGAMRAIL